MPFPRQFAAACVLTTLIGVGTAQAQPGRPAPSSQPTPNQPGNAQPNPGNPPPGGQPSGDKKPEAAPATPPAVARPADPKSRGARTELDVRPDDAGQLHLNFNGQKWLDVLEWYAEVAHLSLDWQEVPGDFLNLRTQRGYSVEEVRDVLNRHLMDRGFTLLQNGEVLIVVNLKKLDPALVPRVAPDQLAQRQPHEFVKTSFKLEWLIAEQTVEELKPLLSPNGKIWALKATNRIEILDAVSNLQSIEQMLRDEQSGKGQDRLVREFKLQHTRADEVYEQLLGLLGQDKPKKDEGPMDPRRMMQMQQQMMQMQQQQGQQQQQKKDAKVHLVVNRRENSVLASGPSDQIALCEQAVKVLDVPRGDDSSLLQNPNRMQIYRLTSIDPEPLVETLSEIGQLDPETQLRVDKKHKSIIAFASLADHVTIRALIEKLDGTDRKFEVIRLRRLEADYVAGTIQFMMGEAEQKQQNRRSSYYFYDPFSMGGSGNDEQGDTRKFRVDADVEHNRLLIWANEVELAEIQKLLVKLGEIPAVGSRAASYRTIDSIPPEDAREIIERLRQAWPNVGGNPIEVKVKPPVKPETPAAQPARPDNTSTEAPTIYAPSQPPLFRFSKASVTSTSDDSGPDSARPQAEPTERITGATPTQGEEAASGPARSRSTEGDSSLPRFPSRRPTQKAPITIELDEEGRWTLQSDDTEALDQLEDLLADLTPPRRDYRLFQLKHATSWAYSIALTLEDFFKEQEDKTTQRRPFWYYDSQPAKTDDARRLSKRRPLKFIADSDSNSILVVGADSNQMRIIEELINYYDQPVASDAKALRRTEVIQVKHSEARVIADAIKDVYRDLLSENDKALQPPPGQGNNQQQRQERSVTYVYDNFGDSSGDKKDAPQPMRFKGALSIGVDEVSNSLVISSTESLLENIRRTIEALDVAAKPNLPTLQVIAVNRDIPLGSVQERLARLLKERQKQQRQPQNPQQNGQPNQLQQAQESDSRFP